MLTTWAIASRISLPAHSRSCIRSAYDLTPGRDLARRHAAAEQRGCLCVTLAQLAGSCIAVCMGARPGCWSQSLQAAPQRLVCKCFATPTQLTASLGRVRCRPTQAQLARGCDGQPKPVCASASCREWSSVSVCAFAKAISSSYSTSAGQPTQQLMLAAALSCPAVVRGTPMAQRRHLRSCLPFA